MVDLAITPANSINNAATYGIQTSDPTNSILVTTGAWVLTSGPAGAGFHGILLSTSTTTSVVSINGTVGATEGHGIANGFGGATIAVGQAGYVSGFAFDGSGIGILLTLASSISNAGTITGNTAIQLRGIGNVVTNTGLISGTGNNGLSFTSLAAGTNAVVNSGTVAGKVNAINCGVQDDTVTNIGLLAGAVLLGNGINVVTNDGEIAGSISSGTGSDTVTNRGVIGGSLTLGDGTNTVTNAGTMAGAITGGTGTDTVTNHGSISGTINLGGGADKYDGSGGTALSSIILGSGDDIGYGGDFADTFEGGDGIDQLVGNGGNDTFLASSTVDGSDTIDGGTGQDSYDATSAGATVIIDLDEGLASGTSIGNDLLASIENATGSAFADTLTGDDFANILKGLAGNDVLTGAAGKDTLDGGDGADTLTGGAARDLLYGGGADSDIDIFDYNSVTESGITGGTRDAIMDFEDGFDKIDLTTIDAKTFLKGNQAFTFIGAGSFTSAGGQVRSFVNSAGNTVIQINSDHDTAVEMSLVVHGTPSLSAADFFL